VPFEYHSQNLPERESVGRLGVVRSNPILGRLFAWVGCALVSGRTSEAEVGRTMDSILPTGRSGGWEAPD